MLDAVPSTGGINVRLVVNVGVDCIGPVPLYTNKRMIMPYHVTLSFKPDEFVMSRAGVLQINGIIRVINDKRFW